MRGPNTALPARRVGVARALLLLAFAGLAARAAHLSVVERRGADRGLAQTQRRLALPPARGAIVDRAGAELALTVPAPSVYAIPSAVEDPERAARALAPLLGLDRPRLAARLREGGGFAFLARWVSGDRARRVRALGLAGVGVLDEPRRVYPHRELAAQVLGFANIDGVGVRGVEQLEDDWLRGTARELPAERDGDGELLLAAQRRGGEADWGTAGGNVALTLDATLQAQAEAALREALRATGARGGVVISVEPATGDVLALAEAPGFDPNRFRELPYADTRSRAFLDAADPGSTLKAFLVAAALERRAIDPRGEFDCEETGSYRVPGKTIRDRVAHGRLPLAGVLRVSSNICAVKIAQALGPRAHSEMLRRFGFGAATGSFPDESAGLLRPWRSWRPLDHATIAFGQGVSVTPIQLAMAMAALANGGQLLRPRLVAARQVPGGRWRPTRPRVAHRAVGGQTARTVLRLLEDVVATGGTGRRAGLRGLRVAGKTGTAQKYDPGSGRYAPDRFGAWFVGAVPADDPRLVIAVGLDEPRRPHHTGGAAAAPLFARVAAAQLTRLGIDTRPEPAPAPQPVETRVASAAPPAPAPARPAARPPGAAARAPREAQTIARVGDRVLLPDLTGLTVAEVLQITAHGALWVEISGSGRAVAQEPEPGTVLRSRGVPVRVRFEPPRGGDREI